MNEKKNVQTHSYNSSLLNTQGAPLASVCDVQSLPAFQTCGLGRESVTLWFG